MAFLVVTAMCSSTFATDVVPRVMAAVQIGFFEKAELPSSQCGCWYYYPLDQKLGGRVVAVGKSAEDALHVKINGRESTIGNWKADHLERVHFLSYGNDHYRVDIRSEVLEEGKFSGE